MIALEWRDVDLGKRQICVQRSDWNGQVTTPKGGRLRYVPLTIRLAAAFRDHRHLRSPNVLSQDDGQPLTWQMVQYGVRRAARVASSEAVAGVHILRHTFCSHLAMRGAPPRAIQELAGHRELGMTQRYMHLSPAALDSGIRLLDQPLTVQSFGDILETGRVSEGEGTSSCGLIDFQSSSCPLCILTNPLESSQLLAILWQRRVPPYASHEFVSTLRFSRGAGKWRRRQLHAQLGLHSRSATT